MRLLLDTNVLLWMLDDDTRLGASARAGIHHAEALAVSVASLWEIAIKISIRKLAPIPGLHDAVGNLGLERLPIAGPHLLALQELPHLHRDPFDRLLISQALVERLTVLTADPAFASYDVPVIDAHA